MIHIKVEETQALLPQNLPQRSAQGVLRGAVVAALALAGIAGAVLLRRPVAAGADFSAEALQAISVTDSNYATPQSVLEGLLPWANVFEPHHEYKLAFGGAAIGEAVTWTVSTKQNDGAFAEVRSWKGLATETAVLATKAGLAHKLSATTASGRTASVEFMAKHVRRELRSLTDSDREEFLAAVAVVYTTPTIVGQKKYGEAFHGVEWFTRWHMADQRPKVSGSYTSPWHANPSFFTAHAAFADYFERALQSVNPKVAAHYWDYTIDAALDDWTTSIVWDDAWYGTGSAENDFVVGGRWAGVEHSVVMEDGGEESNGVTHNSYGIDTMPYNNNPAMKLSRAQSLCDLKSSAIKLPGCSDLEEVYQVMPLNNLVRQYAIFDGLMHTNVHTVLGGLWSCTESAKSFLEEYPNATDALTTFLKMYPEFVQNYYMDESIVCPDKCTIGVTAFEDCMCHSAEDESESDITAVWKQRFASMVESQKLPGLLHIRDQLIKNDDGTYDFKGLAADESTALTTLEAKLLSSPPKFSDFASPFAAPFDPIFFAVHIFNEMVWTAIRVKYDDNEFIEHDKYWAAADYDADADDDTFKGHNYDDPMEPFSNAYGKVREPAGTYYTNRELMHLYSPLQDALPYIFDSLSSKHCDM